MSVRRFPPRLFLLFALLLTGVSGKPRVPETPSDANFSYQHLPLRFERNEGQSASQVKFLARTAGYSLFLTEDEALLNLKTVKQTAADTSVQHSATVRMKLRGDYNHSPQIEGEDELPGVTHYYRGNDPKEWLSGVKNFGSVRYRSVYPGIDLRFYGNEQTELEHDFDVAPGADYRQIRFTFDGAKSMQLDPEGNLEIVTESGSLVQRKPVVYQEVAGEKRYIESSYHRLSEHEFGFEIAPYDGSAPLVIDPSLMFSTYLGGNNYDGVRKIAVGKSGKIYAVGSAGSADFPTTLPTLGVAQSPDLEDGFLTVFRPGGQTVAFTIAFGGSDVDNACGVSLDAAENIYVTGLTRSLNFPTKLPLQAHTADDPLYIHNGINNGTDQFFIKFDQSGGVVFSSYFGGNSTDFSYSGTTSSAVDSSGSLYLAFGTMSSDLPTTANALLRHITSADSDPDHMVQGGISYLAKINPSGRAVDYGTYFGTPGGTLISDLAIDDSGNAYVSGNMANGTVWKDPTQTCSPGRAIIAKINCITGKLVYATCLAGDVAPNAIALSPQGKLYIAGSAYATTYTASPNAYQPTYIGDGGWGHLIPFIGVLNQDGSQILALTYFGSGSNGAEYWPTTIALAPNGDVYIAGSTTDANLPLKSPFQKKLSGNSDGFIAKFNPSLEKLLLSTYLGGSVEDYISSMVVDSDGHIFVGGQTGSKDFPVKRPYQGANRGVDNGFVGEIIEGGGVFLR